MNLNDILRESPLWNLREKIKLVRHLDTRNKERYNVKELYEKNQINIYQSFQDKNIFMNKNFIVVFLGIQGSAKSILIGVYSVSGPKPATQEQLNFMQNLHLEKTNKFFYETFKTNYLEDLDERLVIDWGKALLSWHQKLDESKPKKIVDIYPKRAMQDFFQRGHLRGDYLINLSSNQIEQQFDKIVGDEISKDTTEREALVRIRVGQDFFRNAQLYYWGSACAVTGITMPEILRASHIKPWAKCDNTVEQLDVYNGFLLSPTLDVLFDRGYITFNDKGKVLVSSIIDDKTRESLSLNDDLRLRKELEKKHKYYLTWHHENKFKGYAK